MKCKNCSTGISKVSAISISVSSDIDVGILGASMLLMCVRLMLIDSIYDLIVETVVGKGGSMTIFGQQYPRELVKSRFLKLNMSHVEYVMECLRRNTTKVYNIKAYLLAALFNAGTTM